MMLYSITFRLLLKNILCIFEILEIFNKKRRTSIAGLNRSMAADSCLFSTISQANFTDNRKRICLKETLLDPTDPAL